MSRLLPAALLALCAAPSRPAAALPATGLSYRIEATLDTETRDLTGREEIRWSNPSDTPVWRVPLHLYLNAFSHEGTTWMREVAGRWIDVERFTEVHGDPWGWLEPTAIRQRARGEVWKASWAPAQPDDGNPLDRTLASVTLPVPVRPGEELVLEVEFAGRMPAPFARTGCVPGWCMVVHWYPKLAVFEPVGVRHAARPRWVLHQFHAPTEFYADFADYDVTLEVPAGLTVEATGRADDVPEPVEGGRRRVRYRQRAVHDFAWLAGRDLSVTVRRYQPAGRGGPVDVRYVVPRGLEHQGLRLAAGTEATLDELGRRVGPYPYDVLTVVAPPWRGRRTAGMEYPTLSLGVPADPLWDGFPFSEQRHFELIAAHEVAHQYFYGLIANDEREEAFLDEGPATYWEGEVAEALFPETRGGGRLLGRTLAARAIRTLALSKVVDTHRDPVRRRPSFLLEPGTRRAKIYSRPALAFATAEALFGSRVLDLGFSTWYRRFAFGHPDVDDLLAAFGDEGGPDLAAFVAEALSRPRVPDFAVGRVTSKPWSSPRGRLTLDGEVTLVTAEGREEQPLLGLDPAAAEEDGRVLVEVTDPGWDRDGRREEGRVVRRRVAPLPADAGGEARPASGDVVFESRVRVTGPAWDHLPVEVELRFSDGVRIREPWDGRAAWRGYRFLRPARLVEARIGPEERLAVDARPENDGRLREPDDRFCADWAGWLAAVGQWLLAGLTLWL